MQEDLIDLNCGMPSALIRHQVTSAHGANDLTWIVVIATSPYSERPLITRITDRWHDDDDDDTLTHR